MIRFQRQYLADLHIKSVCFWGRAGCRGRPYLETVKGVSFSDLSEEEQKSTKMLRRDIKEIIETGKSVGPL